MDFFSACKTQEEAKQTFRMLAKCFHTDTGGNNDLMRELIKQHDAWSPNNANYQDSNKYYAGFNKSKTQPFQRNAPFDHPLQETIKSLEAQITGLHAKIAMIEGINADLQRGNKTNYDQLNHWRGMYSEQYQINREQKARIETLREILDNKPKTLWQYLKNLWDEL